MKPLDYRRATWADVQGRVSGLRLRTLLALQKHGPCTTRALAGVCTADILTIRPRVTELIQLGFVQAVPGQAQGHEGVYRALSLAETQSLFARRRAAAQARSSALDLPLSEPTDSARRLHLAS
jgi:hypothetical protein